MAVVFGPNRTPKPALRLGRAVRKLRPPWFALGAVSICCSGILACADSVPKYPLQDPLWVDPDQHPFSERPEEYYSALGWDGADQTAFRPLTRLFAVDPAGEAINVTALDEVPNSSWFQNRIGQFPMSNATLARGPCTTEPLDPNEPWLVTEGKPNGANPGFIIRGPDGNRYLIKFDGELQGPRATAADVIGSRLYFAAGYYTPCNRIVYFDRSILTLAVDATAEDAKGNEEPLTDSHLDQVFAKGLRLRDGRFRASASLFLDGQPIGPWRYQGTRADDPNDVIAHENRRELRGMRLLASWINHFDSREQNTLATWQTVKGKGGYVRHNVIDFGDSLGSLWQPPALGRRLGHSYYMDFGDLGQDLFTFGLIERPWGKARFGPSGRIFGYFDTPLFVADKWKPGYPNPAFGRMQERDAAWMARIIARFSREHVWTLVKVADLRDAFLEKELFRILWGRRRAILARYFSRLSPLGLPRLSTTEQGATLCLEDLAVSSELTWASRRQYRHRAWVGKELRAIDLRGASRKGAQTCVPLPRVSGTSKTPKYLIVDFIAQTKGYEPQPPARVHLYQLGGTNYKIVALERPYDADPPG